MKCTKCGKVVEEVVLRQDRKPGLNPYESALGVKDGFTEPRPCCPNCEEYLDLEVLEREVN